MLIRAEIPADEERIREIHLAAFADHPFSAQTEHLIVDALRSAGALSISLVAEGEGVVTGHVAFSPVTIGSDSSGWFTLGPVAVDLGRQGQGIGAALITAGLDELRDLGADGCFLVGDPGYYTRFGFRHDPAVLVDEVPPEYVLCLPFGSKTPEGTVVLHPAFWAQA